MTRMLFPALLIATPVLADEGLHHHPHGIDFGWALGVAALCGVGGFVLAKVRGRK
jgi:hypothetical protein